MIGRSRTTRRVALASLTLAFGIASSAGLGAKADDVFSGVDRFHAQEMERMRAGDGDVTTNVAGTQDFEVSSSGNSVTADVITNGAVSITGEAMKNFGGVANLVFTSGNSNSVTANINVIVVLEQ
jgi:hypothetical protein